MQFALCICFRSYRHTGVDASAPAGGLSGYLICAVYDAFVRLFFFIIARLASSLQAASKSCVTRFAQAFGCGGAASQDSAVCTKPALDGLRQQQRGIITRQQMNAKGIPECEQSGMPLRVSNNIRSLLGCTRSIIRAQTERSSLPLRGRRRCCPDSASS